MTRLEQIATVAIDQLIEKHTEIERRVHPDALGATQLAELELIQSRVRLIAFRWPNAHGKLGHWFVREEYEHLRRVYEAFKAKQSEDIEY